MSDFLLDVAQNPRARALIKTLNLPIPLPQKLARAAGPWQERELEDAAVTVGAAAAGSLLAETIARALIPDGANPVLTGVLAEEATLRAPFEALGEAYGRPPTRPATGDTLRHDALVYDASAIADSADLRGLYDFFSPRIGDIARSGRVVVLGRPQGAGGSPATQAAQAALDGFVRSVAKEIGKRGATANRVTVEAKDQAAAEPLVRWLLSPRSAFVTGQTFHVHAGAQAPAKIPRTRPLAGKVALITGGARGIGAETARAMAAEGAKVVVLDRPADDGPASTIAREVGGEVLLVDVSTPEAAQTIATAMAERHGGVDIVVHSAGVTRDKTLAKMDEARWDQALGINLQAVVAITEALAASKDGLRDGGRVICISSIAGIAGNFGQTNYAASKAGVIGFVRGLAPTLNARGIAVIGVAPGFIETRLTAAIPTATREVARRMSALAQGGLPIDVAELITFLSSPGAYGLSGDVIRVCGGSLVGA